jgi:hypothetical protein
MTRAEGPQFVRIGGEGKELLEEIAENQERTNELLEEIAESLEDE